MGTYASPLRAIYSPKLRRVIGTIGLDASAAANIRSLKRAGYSEPLLVMPEQQAWQMMQEAQREGGQ